MEHFIAEESVLKLSSQDSFLTNVPWLGNNLGSGCDFLDLVELGLVLADIGRVGLAGMSGSPGLSARGLEATRLISSHVIVARQTCLELLVERDEEAGRCAIWN